MAKFKPVEVRPASGGKLMTSVSAETAGLFNYTVKRDFRRFLDQEWVSEGYDQFAPLPLTVVQPPTNGEPITLVSWIRRPNGRIAVVCGTKTTLFRYYAINDGPYFVDGYIDPGYFDDNPGVWITIGTGFSRSGSRWQAESINGYLWLNNGVDLPVTYREEDFKVTPVYEMREQGMASVGSISQLGGIPMAMDIRQLHDDKLTALFKPVPSAVNAGVTGAVGSFPILGRIDSGLPGFVGNTVTAAGFNFSPYLNQTIRMANGLARTLTVVGVGTATIDGDPIAVTPDQRFYIETVGSTLLSQPAAVMFPDIDPADAVGLQLMWSDGNVRIINGVVGGFFSVNSDYPVPVGPLTIENPDSYGAITDASTYDRFAWRILPGLPDDPTRWAASIPVTVDLNSNILTLDYPVKSLFVGQEIVIIGAGTDGSNLTATIGWIQGTKVYVNDQVITTQNATLSAALAADKAAVATAQAYVDLTAASVVTAQTSYNVAAQEAQADPLNATKQAAAAAASAALTTAQNTANDAQTALTAAQAALTALEATVPSTTTIVASDTISSIAGKYSDLQDAGDAILRAMALRTTLVVFKEESIFLGSYTGDVNTPFTYTKITIPESTVLFYVNTIALVTGKDAVYPVAAPFLIYAGRNAFYRFDLTNQMPAEIPEFQVCQTTFLDEATQNSLGPAITPTTNTPTLVQWTGLFDDQKYQLTIAGSSTVLFPTDGVIEIDNPTTTDFILQTIDEAPVFVADNTATRELFFFYPGAGDDKVLRFDYRHGTVSTSSLTAMSASMVIRPEQQLMIGQSESWFVMGTADGKLLRYGCIAKDSKKSGTITASKSGSIVTASAPIFTARDIGRSIQFPQDESVWAIVGYIDQQHVQVLDPDVIPTFRFNGGLLQFFDVTTAQWYTVSAGGSPTTFVINGTTPCRLTVGGVLQLLNPDDGLWYSVEAANMPTQTYLDTAGTQPCRIKNFVTLQLFNPDDNLWHTLGMNGDPPQLTLDPNGES